MVAWDPAFQETPKYVYTICILRLIEYIYEL